MSVCVCVRSGPGAAPSGGLFCVYVCLCVSGLDRELLHLVAWSPAVMFTEPAMRTGIQCWEWVLSARPDLEISFLREMCAAWQVRGQSARSVCLGRVRCHDSVNSVCVYNGRSSVLCGVSARALVPADKPGLGGECREKSEILFSV